MRQGNQELDHLPSIVDCISPRLKLTFTNSLVFLMFDVRVLPRERCNQLAICKMFLKVMTCDCCIASFRSQGKAQFLIPKFLKLHRQDGSGLISESFHPVDLQRSPTGLPLAPVSGHPAP